MVEMLSDGLEVRTVYTNERALESQDKVVSEDNYSWMVRENVEQPASGNGNWIDSTSEFLDRPGDVETDTNYYDQFLDGLDNLAESEKKKFIKCVQKYDDAIKQLDQKHWLQPPKADRPGEWVLVVRDDEDQNFINLQSTIMEAKTIGVEGATLVDNYMNPTKSLFRNLERNKLENQLSDSATPVQLEPSVHPEET